MAKRYRVVRNTEGFKDGSGKFHPIRSGDDYDPEDVGERRTYAPLKKKKKAKVTAKKKNPLPVGKFVKVDSVRLNGDGTISILKSATKRKRAKRAR